MANHRPKSLSELNQVYDKAMQAQRAIKEGSRSLSDDVPGTEAPSQNIFEELKQQAATAKKPELYDSEIADIANDFLKRYTKPEQRKPQAASKELKRPAPSIQSLYHTPVKQQEAQPSKDISMGQSEPVEIKAPALGVTRPKPFESIDSEVPEVTPEPEEEIAPAPVYKEPEAAPQQTVQFSVPEAYIKSPAPVSRMTSAERTDLINEYKRVMSDDDDAWFDDDDSYAKPKKSSFWSRLTKRRQEPVEEAFEETAEENPAPPAEEPREEEDEALDMTDIYSGISEYPAEEDQQEPQEAPMSLYDYLEADFDYGDETDEAAEEAPEALPEEVQEEADISPEEEAFTQAEEALEAQDTAEEAQAIPETQEIIGEDLFEAEEQEADEAEEIIPQEEAAQQEAQEETEEDITAQDFAEEYEQEDSYIQEIIPEEEISDEAEEEAVIYPEEEVTQQDPEEELPTAGMVFDDIFSVSDESKRSYTGGDWGRSEDEPESNADFDEDEKEQAVKSERKAKRNKKKLHPAVKVLLSLVLVVLIALAGVTTALGSLVGVDTGKLFGDSYRAFCAQQNYTVSGVAAGDLVLTQDLGTSAATGESFVYVNSQTQQFMIGKLKGTTYGLTGDLLYVAENDAGSTLILREDTLGVIVKTYGGAGSILSVMSSNFIIIDAVILVLFIAVLLVLVLSGKGKKQKLTQDAESSPSAAYAEEYPDEAEAPSDSEDYDDDDFDPEEYDTDDIEESLFSGI